MSGPAGADVPTPAGPASARVPPAPPVAEPASSPSPPAGTAPSGRAARSDARWLVALTVLALLVRLPGLGGDLWLDEIGSLVGFVRRPLDELLVTFVSANNHVLYSILGHLSLGAFGETSWALRLPALLFGAATPAMLVVLARQWLPRREALAAGLALALGYHHAYFSQNGRGYTGFVLAALVTTWALARALRGGARRHWLTWALVTPLAIHLLLSALFVCAGQVLGVLACHVLPASAGTRAARLATLARWLGLAALGTLALYAPLIPSMLEFFATADRGIGWKPSWELVQVVLRDASPHPLVLVAAALAVPFGIAGLLSLLRRAPLLAFSLAVPVVLELGVALAMGVGTYPRRFLLLLPFVLVVAVRGAALAADLAGRLADRPVLGRALFVLLVAAGTAASAAGLPRLWTTPKQDFTGALAWVAERRAPGDVVAATHTATTAMALYGPDRIPDLRHAREPERLAALLEEDRPIWLIGTFEQDMRTWIPELAALVDAHFRLAERRPGLVGDGDVLVWASSDPAPAAAGPDPEDR